MKARMSPVLSLLRIVAGLFFDHGLAIAVLIVLAATAILMNTAWFDGPAAMVFLVGGVIGALLGNVVRTARVFLFKD